MRCRLVHAVVGTRGCRQQLARVKPLPFEHRATSAWVAAICPRCREQTTLPGPLFTTGLTATARPRERIEIPQSVRPIRWPNPWSARSDGPPGGRNGAVFRAVPSNLGIIGAGSGAGENAQEEDGVK
jgi:hypothetical protein